MLDSDWFESYWVNNEQTKENISDKTYLMQILRKQFTNTLELFNRYGLNNRTLLFFFYVSPVQILNLFVTKCVSV